MLNKGDKINNYTLEKYLGKGSYGEVWLAKKSIELSDDGILVALKFLGYQPQKDKTQESFLKQVKREVGTWIKASGHKNIVSVQDGFAFRDDTFVIVSDFAEGGSLGDWLNTNGGKSPSLEKTVEIMSEILDGLAHLHSQNPDKIIHRDLKPDNVLFKSGVPCITDFGVSRMSQTITQSMAQVAATSAGTPLYMSPESFNNQPASRSMDIWSAGVILYQMLSGDFPYYSESIYVLGFDVVSNPPKPLLANIPSQFQAIVAKALEKDVSQRFQTAEEMKASLKYALKTWETVQIKPGISDTIIDEDFNKPELLPIQPTEDWRELEAKKLQQRTFAETPKNKEAEETLTDKRENKSIGVPTIILALILLLFVGLPIFIGLIWAIPWRPTANKNTDITINQPSNQRLTNQNSKTENRPLNANSATTPLSTPSNGMPTIKNSSGMEFVKIPSGWFMMGSENGNPIEKPVHKVTISNNFYLGKYEVTQVQWKEIMGNNPSDFKGDNLPVENVSWEDAQEFIKKLNAKGEGIHRLPTEAEWEYACRAGTTDDYSGNLDAMAWYEENSGSRTHEVGTKQPNLWGLYDMNGNVREWCEDWFYFYSSNKQTDPKRTTPDSVNQNLTRVMRGGGWDSPAFNPRSAYRGNYKPSLRVNNLGFRLVREN